MQVQEAQRVPKKLDPKRNTAMHIIIPLPKIKNKDRILEAAREKDTVTYKEVPIRLSADFSEETLRTRKDWQETFSYEKQEPTANIALPSKDIQNRRADKELPRQEKTEGVHHHQTIII